MTRGNRTAERVVSQLRPSTSLSICNSCLHALNRRHASTAAATISTPPLSPPPIVQNIPPLTTTTAPHQSYALKAGVLLSRPPILTRDLTPFEKAFFLYQRRLNERLAMPFTRYFYIKKGTPQDIDWKRKMKERLTPARDIGVYQAYGDEAWNDEVLVGAKESEPEHQIEALLRDADPSEEEEAMGVKREKAERPLPRVTEADRSGDMRSLNRALQRTLYLVVKGGEGRGWEFPSDGLIRKESLQRAAERILVQAGGVNMNTWVVGHHPVGHRNLLYPAAVVDEEKKTESLGEKTFFMKARIMAGQANLKDNQLGLEDFKWLAKEEVRKQVEPRYWHSIKNMLAER